MKINQKTISVIGAIAILVLTIGKMKLFHYYPDNSFDVASYSSEPTDLDSLGDGIREATNKLDKLKREKEVYLTGFDLQSGMSIGPVGIYEVSFVGKNSHLIRNYLQLTFVGLKFEDNEINGKTYLIYQIKNGQPYIITKKLIKTNYERKVVNVYKKVNYLYSSSENNVLIPIDSSFLRICVFGFGIALSVFFLSLSLFAIITFFKFLFSVANDKAFTKVNVKRLRNISLTLLILALFQHLVNLIIYCVFILNYGSEGVTITKSFFDAEYYVLIFAILCYLLYTAFKKAMILQQENELTI